MNASPGTRYREARRGLLTELSALRPPPQLLRGGLDLTESEAQALAARAVLFPLLHGIYATRRPTPRLRGWAAGLLLRPASRSTLLLHRMTAAWIYGCAPEPRLLECSARRTLTHKFHRWEEAFVTRRFTGYSRFEDLGCGPVRATTPLRTCADLALFARGPRADVAIATMLRAPELGCSPPVVEAALHALRRVPHRAEALERIRRLAPWP
ncbi:hypothetical protein [Rothia halotolerans]|uniref:hypothetical protein n=1 Tax=Rothia halotolerans TaxID=405770 RepID=UPI00101D9289|nr:hypothetical protein [Rothia halotolerans]